MKTVIMAGGKGTRIASVAPDIPKPMISVCGKPILEYQINCLKKNGLKDILIVTGHLGHIIKDYFNDGSKFDCNITYYTEKNPLGTAGALYKIKDTLTDDFVLLNGDIIFDINFQKLSDFHTHNRALSTLVTHPNNHPYDSALLITDTENRIIKWINKEEPRQYYPNLVNAGIHILSKKILESAYINSEKADLDRDILKPLISSHNIFSYKTPEYIKDMGTPDRYEQVIEDIKNGIVAKKNLIKPQRAIFLDRDGTINKSNGFVLNPDDFELIEGAAGAISLINHNGYLAIVITNQPAIARGELSFEELRRIHDKMETELGKSGAWLDDIFFCPHHPDKGFPGERSEYKIDCECRKPKPGMIIEAAKKYNIDLSKSYMAGDSRRDIQAALRAGCTPILITGKTDAACKEYDTVISTFSNIKQFTDRFFKNNHSMPNF
jgi:D-glycero-D-manno-heptose 1,7-bisphosphate phosphatase